MVKRYLNFSLNRELAEKVQEFIERRKDLGYTSVSEFAKDAIRRLLVEYDEKK